MNPKKLFIALVIIGSFFFASGCTYKKGGKIDVVYDATAEKAILLSKEVYQKRFRKDAQQPQLVAIEIKSIMVDDDFLESIGLTWVPNPGPLTSRMSSKPGPRARYQLLGDSFAEFILNVIRTKTTSVLSEDVLVRVYRQKYFQFENSGFKMNFHPMVLEDDKRYIKIEIRTSDEDVGDSWMHRRGDEVGGVVSPARGRTTICSRAGGTVLVGISDKFGRIPKKKQMLIFMKFSFVPEKKAKK